MSNTNDDFNFDEFDETDQNSAVSQEDEKALTSTPVDSKEPNSDTTANTKVAKPKAAAKRSGKASGKKTGGKTRQQKRVPMYIRQPLSTEPRPGYTRRIVNGDPARVARFKQAGWNLVEDGTQIGDEYAGQASSMGSVSSKPVGGGRVDVLMEIPTEFYEEDQAAKQREVDRTEEAMLQEAADSINQAAGGKDEWAGEIKLGKAAPQ